MLSPGSLYLMSKGRRSASSLCHGGRARDEGAFRHGTRDVIFIRVSLQKSLRASVSRATIKSP